MEKYVTACFADVPTNGLPPDDFTEFKDGVSFDTPAFRKMYKVKPFKDVSQVCEKLEQIVYDNNKSHGNILFLDWIVLLARSYYILFTGNVDCWETIFNDCINKKL